MERWFQLCELERREEAQVGARQRRRTWYSRIPPPDARTCLPSLASFTIRDALHPPPRPPRLPCALPRIAPDDAPC